MNNKIEISTIFASNRQDVGNSEALINPFKIIPTPYMPSLITMTVTFIITGLNDKIPHTFKVVVKHKESGTVIYESKPQKFVYVDPYNTVVNVFLDNAKFGQNDGGVYNADIYIDDVKHEQKISGGDYFTIIKTKK